jgi:hypothetical protein
MAFTNGNNQSSSESQQTAFAICVVVRLLDCQACVGFPLEVTEEWNLEPVVITFENVSFEPDLVDLQQTQFYWTATCVRGNSQQSTKQGSTSQEGY